MLVAAKTLCKFLFALVLLISVYQVTYYRNYKWLRHIKNWALKAAAPAPAPALTTVVPGFNDSFMDEMEVVIHERRQRMREACRSLGESIHKYSFCF